MISEVYFFHTFALHLSFLHFFFTFLPHVHFHNAVQTQGMPSPERGREGGGPGRGRTGSRRRHRTHARGRARARDEGRAVVRPVHKNLEKLLISNFFAFLLITQHQQSAGAGRRGMPASPAVPRSASRGGECRGRRSDPVAKGPTEAGTPNQAPHAHIGIPSQPESSIVTDRRAETASEKADREKLPDFPHEEGWEAAGYRAQARPQEGVGTMKEGM